MPLVPHVAPNTTITSAWGNLVSDHVISRFTNAAQRTSQLTAPATGQLTTLDTAPGVVEFWNGTIWRPPVGAIVGRGTVTVPDVNRTSNGLVDAPIIGITPFAYPVSMVATAHVQGGFGSALHSYQMDFYLHSIAAGIAALGPIQAGGGAFGAVSYVHSWPVAAGVDPSWRVRVNPSTATAGNAFHTGGGASWVAYAT